jgi:hypothetical protein
MGEIKSTLDLVLERTKHLTLSGDEKKAQRQKEIRQKTTGLVQRFEDQVLNEEQFRREVDRLQMDYDLTNKDFLRDAILRQLDIGQPADRLMTLLERFCQVDTSGLKQVFSDFEQILTEITEQKSSELKTRLRKTHRISGYAVTANLDKDPAWQQQLQLHRREYQQQLIKQAEAVKK